MNGDGATWYQYPSAGLINLLRRRGRLPTGRWTDRV